MEQDPLNTSLKEEIQWPKLGLYTCYDRFWSANLIGEIIPGKSEKQKKE